MSGPLAGVGGFQSQVQTFQPGRNTEARQQQEVDRQNNDVRNTEVAEESQQQERVTETRRSSSEENTRVATSRSEDVSQGSGRGGNVDILV